MKTQIKFQKKLALITLIVAVLAFIFAICFFSGNLSDVMSYRLSLYRESYSSRVEVNGQLQVVTAITANLIGDVNDWILSAQAIDKAMVTMTIIFFVVIAFIYITCTNSRRNYYITNYVMTGIVVVYAVALALYGIISMIVLMNGFMNLQFTSDSIEFQVLNSNANFPAVTYSPVMFIIGIVAFLLVLLVALAWIYNLIWKTKLMKGEQELLSKGYVKEVA